MAFNATFHNSQLNDAQTRLASVSLHSANPPTSGNEVTTVEQRQVLSWSNPTGGSMSAFAAVAVNAGVTVRAVGFFDASTTPVFQGGGPVDVEETYNNPGTANINVSLTEV